MPTVGLQPPSGRSSGAMRREENRDKICGSLGELYLYHHLQERGKVTVAAQ
jgi:hypothetical protein